MGTALSVEIFPGLLVSQEDVLADVGCGGGDVCVKAGMVGAAVHAVDTLEATLKSVSARMVSVPSRSFKAHLAVSDVIPLPDACATVVVCTEVIEHVGDAHLFMNELFRIGKPGARYLISAPDCRSEAVMKAITPPEMWQPPNHVRVLKEGELKSVAEGAGLEVEAERFVGFYWSIWWALRFAIGTYFCPGFSVPAPPVLAKWEEAWTALISMPSGEMFAQELDRALPKSVIITARKPVRTSPPSDRLFANIN